MGGPPFAQSERSIGIVPEIQAGKNFFVGLGVSRGNFFCGEGGGGGFGITSAVEYNPFAKIVAPKLNVWMNGYFFLAGGNIGLNGIYYVSGDKTNFVIRPEIGLGLLKVFLNYGYNIHLADDFPGINKHTFTLTYYHTFYPWKKNEVPYYSPMKSGE